jgi:hypothetical protein
MNLFRALAVGAGFVLLVGCAAAPQQAVPLAPEVVGAGTARIGVAMAPMPKVNTAFPGAGCLLCMAAAEVANQSLTAHTQTLPADDLLKLKPDAVKALTTRGAQVTTIAEALDVNKLPSAKNKGPNIARKDFTALHDKYKVDKLVVIELTSVGVVRPYSSYFPTSDPKASVGGAAYLVNLSNNTYEWYVPLDVQRAADGNWDEAPAFPGLTNAYYQAVEAARDEVLKPLGSTPAARTVSAGPTAGGAAAPANSGAQP